MHKLHVIFSNFPFRLSDTERVNPPENPLKKGRDGYLSPAGKRSLTLYKKASKTGLLKLCRSKEMRKFFSEEGNGEVTERVNNVNTGVIRKSGRSAKGGN